MSDNDPAWFCGVLVPKLVEGAEESGLGGPKRVPEFDESRAWVNPSAADFRDWRSDFGGFEAETGNGILNGKRTLSRRC